MMQSVVGAIQLCGWAVLLLGENVRRRLLLLTLIRLIVYPLSLSNSLSLSLSNSLSLSLVPLLSPSFFLPPALPASGRSPSRSHEVSLCISLVLRSLSCLFSGLILETIAFSLYSFSIGLSSPLVDMFAPVSLHYL